MKASHVFWSIFGWMILLLPLGSFCFFKLPVFQWTENWTTASLPRDSHATNPPLVQGRKRRAPKQLTGLQCFALWSASLISVNQHLRGLGESTPDLTEVTGTCTESFQAALPFISMKLGFGPIHLSHSIYPLPSIAILKHSVAMHLQTPQSIAIYRSCV